MKKIPIFFFCFIVSIDLNGFNAGWRNRLIPRVQALRYQADADCHRALRRVLKTYGVNPEKYDDSISRFIEDSDFFLQAKQMLVKRAEKTTRSLTEEQLKIIDSMALNMEISKKFSITACDENQIFLDLLFLNPDTPFFRFTIGHELAHIKNNDSLHSLIVHSAIGDCIKTKKGFQ